MRSEDEEKTQHNQTLPKTSGIDAYKSGKKRGIRGGNDRENGVNDPEDCAQYQADPKYRNGEASLFVDLFLHPLLLDLRPFS
jgi:hypothetical protein